ncbi:hypothetical protein [Luteimicrobium sp. DT211]|uniref:hypothetical protein n=1 Tax=Luteimicrobium sp. DT211 TaxID=3393412 RepID=UPI003CFAFB53
MSVTHAASPRPGAVPPVPVQLDLFDGLPLDPGNDANAWGVAAPVSPAPSSPEPDAQAAAGPTGLRGADALLAVQGIDRLLLSDAFTTLAGHDRASATLTNVRLHVEVRLDGAGHVLTVASAIEREVRRLESAVAAAGAAPSDAALAGAVAAAGPQSSGPGGLRVAGASGSGGALLLVLEPVGPTTPLTRWPRLSLALAAAAVADRGFRIADGSGPELTVELARQRSRAVAGGLPDEAVTMILVGRQSGVTRQVRVVTTGD